MRIVSQNIIKRQLLAAFFFAVTLMYIAVNKVCGQDSWEKDSLMILNTIETQREYWNKGDLDGFMQAYWKSDSLKFVSKSGVRKGWETVLKNYKLNYNSKETMGVLKFNIENITNTGNSHAFVIGKWMIYELDKNDTPKAEGYFSLLWKKFEDGWKIILDHSS